MTAEIPLNKDTYAECVERNRRTMLSMGKGYNPHFAFMACQKRSIIVPPGTLLSSVGRKYDDAMAAAFAHVLPFYDRHGDDAVDLVNGELTPCELKLSYFDPQAFHLNAKGVLVVKAGGKSFECCANTHYEIMHNAESKRRLTHYVLADDRSNELIDMFSLDADSAYHCVTHYSRGGLRPKTDHKNKITVGLKRFREMGKLHRPEGITVQGIEAWSQRIAQQQVPTPIMHHTGSVMVGNTVFASKELAVQYLKHSKLTRMIPLMVSA